MIIPGRHCKDTGVADAVAVPALLDGKRSQRLAGLTDGACNVTWSMAHANPVVLKRVFT